MYSGHCGYCGIGGVIVTISIVILVLTVLPAAVVLSFNTHGHGAEILTKPYTYNMMGPFMWATGGLCALTGFAILMSNNSRARGPMLSFWMFMMVFHIVIVFVYGISFMKAISQIYLLHRDILEVIITDTAAGAIEPGTKAKQILSPGGKIFNAFEQGSASLVMHYSPFPFNLVFFLGLRPDITAMMFIALPVTFILFCLPFVYAIRSYFISKKEGVVKHRMAYQDVPLSTYMCTGPPISDRDENGDPYSSDEEDLASTFDGEYSGMEDVDVHTGLSSAQSTSRSSSGVSDHSGQVRRRRR